MPIIIMDVEDMDIIVIVDEAIVATMIEVNVVTVAEVIKEVEVMVDVEVMVIEVAGVTEVEEMVQASEEVIPTQGQVTIGDHQVGTMHLQSG